MTKNKESSALSREIQHNISLLKQALAFVERGLVLSQKELDYIADLKSKIPKKNLPRTSCVPVTTTLPVETKSPSAMMIKHQKNLVRIEAKSSR